MKTILLTGGSSGIGRATAAYLSEQGHHVIAIGRDKGRLAHLQAAHPKIETICADLAIVSDRMTVYETIGERKLDVLINNAGIATPTGKLLTTDRSDFRYQMSINVEAPLFFAKRLHENLHGGRILNLSIYSSFKVNPGLGCYGISKAALNMLTQYLKVELAEHNIAVGLTLPGLVDTNIQHQLPEGALAEKAANMKNQGQLLSPETVAHFLSWLVLEADEQQFGADIVDIYDDTHHRHWLPEGVSMQLSQNAQTLVHTSK